MSSEFAYFYIFSSQCGSEVAVKFESSTLGGFQDIAPGNFTILTIFDLKKSSFSVEGFSMANISQIAEAHRLLCLNP